MIVNFEKKVVRTAQVGTAADENGNAVTVFCADDAAFGLQVIETMARSRLETLLQGVLTDEFTDRHHAPELRYAKQVEVAAGHDSVAFGLPLADDESCSAVDVRTGKVYAVTWRTNVLVHIEDTGVVDDTLKGYRVGDDL